jgi:hypothetical protein
MSYELQAMSFELEDLEVKEVLARHFIKNLPGY